MKSGKSERKNNLRPGAGASGSRLGDAEFLGLGENAIEILVVLDEVEAE